ncbi:MAG TPA: SET domain-containing protein-lysine N-methyltransferase [Gemmatimonas sp.]|uniref:SET domain-containing protein n=1 Tax=Gemmatimonas sp. TaxID=1962908 RepID=UPI002EDB0BA5
MSPARKSATPAKPPKSELYEVRRSRIQGRGAFAVKPIRKGQHIDEYWGERITHDEAERRYDDTEGRHHTFLFVLDDNTVIDARRQGTDARFINHSCDPNCETEIEDGHINIAAIKPIKVDEELVYDYRFEWQDEYEPEDVRYYACRCGSKKCRGTILRVPVYLRATVREWLAGNDVKKPRKPAKKSAKTAKKSAKKVAKKAAKKAAKKVVKKTVKKAAKKSAKKSARAVKR